MNEQRHSVALMPGATSVLPFPDVEARLLAERDKHAAIAQVALNKDPPEYVIVAEHNALVALYYEAAETIRRLKIQNEMMAKTLKARTEVPAFLAKA